MAVAVPVVEIAHDGYRGGIRCPHRKTGPAGCSRGSGPLQMRAELLISPEKGALAEVVDVAVCQQHARKSSRLPWQAPREFRVLFESRGFFGPGTRNFVGCSSKVACRGAVATLSWLGGERRCRRTPVSRPPQGGQSVPCRRALR